ncbi:hypothetical protein FKM82_015699 [Ascaphus truei]
MIKLHCHSVSHLRAKHEQPLNVHVRCISHKDYATVGLAASVYCFLFLGVVVILYLELLFCNPCSLLCVSSFRLVAMETGSLEIQTIRLKFPSLRFKENQH